MCKESMQATPCPGCGRRIYYVEQHMPHCTFDKPIILRTRKRKKKKEAVNVA